jgi:hypothetical protein
MLIIYSSTVFTLCVVSGTTSSQLLTYKCKIHWVFLCSPQFMRELHSLVFRNFVFSCTECITRKQNWEACVHPNMMKFDTESCTRSYRANFIFVMFWVVTPCWLVCNSEDGDIMFLRNVDFSYESTRRHNPQKHRQFHVCSFHSSVTPAIHEAQIKHYFSQKWFTLQNIRTLIRIASLWVKNWTQNLLNTKQKCQLNHDLRNVFASKHELYTKIIF